MTRSIEVITTLNSLNPEDIEVVCDLIDREKEQARVELMKSLPLVNWRWFSVKHAWPKQLGRRGAKVGMMTAFASAGCSLAWLIYLIFPAPTLFALTVLSSLVAIAAFVFGVIILYIQLWSFWHWAMFDTVSGHPEEISYHLERWFPKEAADAGGE